MQKKIIALAVASALTVPAMAFAEATLTGQVNMSYDMYKDGAASETTTNRLNSNNSRLIWKGSEDLGGGSSVIWQVDSRFSTDTGLISANTLFGGNNFLGLKSDSMGTLMAGKFDNPYKVATRSLDVFFDVAGDNRAGSGAGIVGLISSDFRWNNEIAYLSPDMSGFSVAASTVFGAESANAANNTKGSAYSLAGIYNAGPINASLSYEEMKAGSNGTGDMAGNGTIFTALFGGAAVDDKFTAMKLGGGYKTDAFVVNAFVEQVKATYAAGGDDKGTNYYVGGKFNFTPNDGVRAAYTKRGSISGVSTVADANQYALGYERVMSKTTSAYATYVKTTDNATGAADPSAFSLGVKHAF
jgi:predicted porin